MVIGITLATITHFNRDSLVASFVNLDELRKALKSQIKDEDRRKSALELAATMTRITDEYDSFLRLSLDRYLELVLDYDSSVPRILEETIRPAGAKRHSTLLSRVDLRSQLRDLLTEEEWTKVFGESDHPPG